jgi:hypothetical protein
MKNTNIFYYSMFIVLFISAILNINCSQSNTNEDSLKTWKYFNIYASSEDNIIFVQLQDDLGISPKMERYIITINLKNKNDMYVILGGEQNFSSKKYSWSMLRKSVQEGLLNWSESNKEKLE